MSNGKIFDIDFFIKSVGDIAKALPTTLVIAVVGFFTGLIIGFFCALIKKYKIPVLKQLVTFYISFFRGTPLLVQIFIFYFGVPIFIDNLSVANNWNLDISGIPAIYFAFFAYSLNTGAYLTEVIRSAIDAVDPGQYEAASSIGMSSRQTFTRIVIPQAFLWALPNLGNTFISLLKDTSLAFSISILEVIGTARRISGSNLRFFEAYLAAALIYWVTCIISEIIVANLERLMKRKRGMA